MAAPFQLSIITEIGLIESQEADGVVDILTRALLDAYVVGREAMVEVRPAMLPKHRHRATDKAAVESVQLLVADGEQALAALVLLLRTDRVGDVESLGSRALAVAEDMELADVEVADERLRLVEERRRLAARAHDDIDTDEGVGHESVDPLDLVGEEARVVAAVHEAQHLVTAALQRDVEMGHERSAGGAEREHLVGEQVGLDARDAVAVDALDAVESLDELEERLARRLAEVADVDARDDNLAATLLRHLARLCDERLDASVATASAGEGNGAVGAVVVATVLNFKEIARAVTARA